MKIGGKEEIILDVLRQQELEGREIVKQSHGAIGYAGIYSRLAQMEDRGLIERRIEEREMLINAGMEKIYPRVHFFKATEAGWKAFLERHATLLPVARTVMEG